MLTHRLDRWRAAAPQLDNDQLIGFYVRFRLQAEKHYEGDLPYLNKVTMLQEMDRRGLIEEGKRAWRQWSCDQGGFEQWFGPLEKAFYLSEGWEI
jgi:hypothetical protein